ncbi:bifunctional 3-(3-hydroxy-phenyl)propionate/3-hydroxycinnamic acid hydroxylase MhpA [Subtercola boreus]|uniref:bifunctional 3-(3-hydroxy-phenyl)propionate/3-hydroxycinnamic acid hydroxylase MhpA n=1 Tax=Subtercola boreus TaxID=120213 RepID=UPI0015591724|nr:bifunctional 3-(3-hydroxy-phenyl)propionate/3-hydroxycinnamic acid hydroxylase [Subtercola boreus]
MKADVLIAGAGPVGLLTAILLGRDGHRVTVIERWPARYPLPRACTIDHEALRILQSAGVMAEHADLFEPSRGERGGYQIRNGEGALLRAIDWNRAAESGWANTNGFYQPDLEAVLESMAADIPTVDVRRGWSVAAVTQDAATVSLTVCRTGDEAEQETLVGSWLIGADGANSAVRDLVGIESVDSGFEADWLVVDYEPLDDREWEAFVTQYCDPRQPATAVNSGPGRRRFEFMRRADVTALELARPDTAWALMAPWNVTPENARLERHAVYTFRGTRVTEWRRGRVLLAGDSAHLMPPFLGQGLCSGLRDASSLAWRLSLIESGAAGSEILDTYGSERSAHVREIIDAAVAIGQTVCELDPLKAAKRDARMLAELSDPDAVTVDPPQPRLGEPSMTRHGDVWAGRLSVQARVEVNGRAALFDDIRGGRWQLITSEADPEALLSPELSEWFTGIGGTITSVSAGEPVRDIDGRYRSWFENHGCTAVLSRPDFYIYGTGMAADVAPLLTSLRERLHSSFIPTQEGARS